MSINFNFVQLEQGGSPEHKETRRRALDIQCLEPAKGEYGTTVTYEHPELATWGVGSVVVAASGIVAFVPSDEPKFVELAQSHYEPRLGYRCLPRIPVKKADPRQTYLSEPEPYSNYAKLRKQFYHITISPGQYYGVEISGPENKFLTIIF